MSERSEYVIVYTLPDPEMRPASIGPFASRGEAEAYDRRHPAAGRAASFVVRLDAPEAA